MNQSVSSAPENVRAEVCAALQLILIDLVTISLVAHDAHVNVSGPQFVQAHALFSDLYTAAESKVDPVAEYISLLGGEARLSNVALVKSSMKPRLPQGLPASSDGLALCAAMFALVQKFGALIEPLIAELGSKDLVAQNDMIDVWKCISVPGWKIGKMLQGGVK